MLLSQTEEHPSTAPLDYTPSKKPETHYPFVDWLRLISMMGIVWAHVPDFPNGKGVSSLDHIGAYFFLLDFFKFGVICFFLISGFLIQKKLDTLDRITFLKRRLSVTFKAYFLVLTIFLLYFILRNEFKTDIVKQPILQILKERIFESPLWFMPNYWLCLFILVCFKKFLSSIYFVFTLIILTLLSSYFLVYTSYATVHTYGVFAFIFYLWLGYHIAKQGLYKKIQNLNLFWLVPVCVLLYVIASYESIFLFKYQFNQPNSILRVSNQLYSVAMFLLFIRLAKKPISTKYINPRKETYGIYLYHAFACQVLYNLEKRGVNLYSDHLGQFIALFLLKYIFMYLVTLMIVKLLIKLNLGYLNIK